MKTATSANALEKLKATEREFGTVSAAYDLALANGSDDNIAAAEEAMTRLRATHARLQRQVGILQTAEAAAEKTRVQRSREEADQMEVRRREEAAAAIVVFWEEFHEQLLELHARARKKLQKPLDALTAAREHADRLHGRDPEFVPKIQVLNGFMADPQMLTERMRSHFGGQEMLMQRNPEFVVLQFLENFVRTVPAEEPRTAA